MTAIGCRAATSGATSRPVSGAGTVSGVGTGVGLGLGVGSGEAVGAGVPVGAGLKVGCVVTWPTGALGVGEPPSELAATTTTRTDAAMMPAMPTAGLRFTMTPPGTTLIAALPRLD